MTIRSHPRRPSPPSVYTVPGLTALDADIIIKNAPDPIFVSDLEGKILSANDAVYELLGFRTDQVLEQSPLRFISPDETREFTAALQEGDAEVFNRIVERFQDMACASAYALIEDVHLAEDITQEAFLEAYLNLAKLRELAAFASWFRRIILKQADRLTRGKCLTSSSLEAVADVPMDSHGQTEIAETNEVRERVHRAISALPERERLVIVLFYGTGYALKDIAAFLDIPVTTVKKRLYDARQLLKDELIDVARDVLQEQRPLITDTFPAKVRLLIAARLGDIDLVKELLARSPMLLSMKTERGEARYQSGFCQNSNNALAEKPHFCYA